MSDPPGTVLNLSDGTTLQVIRVGDRIPRWCFSPMLRGFVMGNAILAPVLLIVWAVLHAA